MPPMSHAYPLPGWPYRPLIRVAVSAVITSGRPKPKDGTVFQTMSLTLDSLHICKSQGLHPIRIKFLLEGLKMPTKVAYLSYKA